MKIIDKQLGSIHLQGLGRVSAKPASELKIGDVILWNYGYSSIIKTIEHFSEKTIRVVLTADDGKECDRDFRVDRLVAYREVR